MNYTPYQRLTLKGMDNQSLINLIRQAAANFPDTSLIVTPRIDQSGQPYYWTGLRYGNTELDFALLLNREIEAFILCFLIKGRDGMTDISNYSPDPTMTREINWLQSHMYRHLEYTKDIQDYIRYSKGRTFQNKKLAFPFGSIVYSQEIENVLSVNRAI